MHRDPRLGHGLFPGAPGAGLAEEMDRALNEALGEVEAMMRGFAGGLADGLAGSFGGSGDDWPGQPQRRVPPVQPRTDPSSPSTKPGRHHPSYPGAHVEEV